jgi:hypothetical protein
MLVYDLQSSTIATSSAFTTNGTTFTESEVVFVKPGSGAKAMIQKLMMQGFANGGTTLNGLMCNVKNWTTASTTGGGTSMTPRPANLAAAVAAQATASANPTAGSGGGTYRGMVSMGGSTPGLWSAANPDSVIEQAAGSAGSCDLVSLAGAVSQPFMWGLEFSE